MLVFEDLGFRVALFFIFLVFPATFFLLRRKWRIAVARKEEINRLLVLASEEAARAEFEASFGYYSSISTPPPLPPRVCAVCFTPTPHRCARCKSVHYCSGKCQIIHWRQGHKDECHPSVNSPEINDEGVGFVGDSGKQFHFEGDIPSGISGNQYDQVEIAPDKHNITPSAHTPPELSINDDKSSVNDPLLGDDLESHVNDHIISDSSESRSSSSDDTCIDDSVSDIDSVHDLNDDSCDSFSMLDNLEPTMGNKNDEQSKPLEMEPNSGVPSNNNVFVSGDLKDKASSKTIGSSGSNISLSNKNISNPVIASSGFWDGSLDYCISKKHEQITNAKPEVGGSGPDMHLQGLEASSPAYPGISNTGNVVSEPISTVKNPRGPTRNRNSTILVSKEPVTRVKVINSDKDFVKSGGVGVVGETAEDSAALPSSASKKAKENDLEGSSEDALHSPVSKRIGVSPKAANGLTLGMKEPNSPAIRSVKAVPIAAVPSQVARPASSTAVGLKTSVLKVVEQFRPPRKNTERAVFSYEVFVKLYHWNKVELRPCGLINCGNSCYANVILQCLAFTPPLTAYLLQGMHSKECVNKDWCFLCEFERLILMAKEGRSPLSPIGILSQLQKIGSHLANGREEDAHEFLRYAIDTMQYPSLQDAGANSLDSLQQETTLMGLTFGGYLRSKIKCTRCHVKSEKQERMMDLTVEISGDIETLEDALRKFTGTEPLDGENKYHCGRCKSYEKAKKKLNILEAPNILTIALKRFQSGKFGKLNKKIQFPEILNLAPYMRGGSDKSPIYRLYGVVVHLDIMNAAFSGHYVCYIRNSQNKWYKIDDSMVKAVELESVLTKGAYMLFYSRVSPRAPRSIRSAIVCRDFQTKTKIPEVSPSQRSANIHSSRRRDASSHVNRAPDDNLANLGHVPPSGTSFSPGRNILDFDSSSDSSSLFSNSDEVSSCTTDSNRDSISADDLSDYFFGYNAFFRHSSDSETSSSSSSSSPEYTKHSPLSNPERYSSARPDDNAHSNRDVSSAENSGPVGGVSFLHSNNSREQVRKLVNISSSRESDGEKLGRSNPLDNGKSGVHLKRSSRTKTD